MKTITQTFIISFLFISQSFAGGAGGEGGPHAKSFSKYSLGLETLELKFDASKISNIQLSNGAFITPNKAAIISKDVKIITGNLFINTNSKEVFDVQMKNGKTCVILDNNCY